MRCRTLACSVAGPERNEQRWLLKARAELVYCLGPPKGGHPMKRALFWLATIGLAVSSPATGKEPAPAATEAGMPAGLADRAAAFSAAVAKRDVAALDDIWPDDYAFINPHGALLPKTQRLENLKSRATAVDAPGGQPDPDGGAGPPPTP